MSDYCFNGLVKFRVDSKIAHVSATDMCSNGGIVGHLSTSPVTCASELEVALLQALDVLPKFH